MCPPPKKIVFKLFSNSAGVSRSGRSRRGTATVEFAVLLPFLFFLFLVTVDFCRVFYFSQTVQNCARNGALYLHDPSTASESRYQNVQEAALADATNLSPPPTVTSTTGTDTDGTRNVEVTVSYSFQTITAYPGIPSTMLLARTVRMRMAPK